MSSKNQDDKVYPNAAILQVLPSLVAGGVERGTVDLTKYLIDKGYRAIVTSCGGPLTQKLIDFGALHIKLKMDSKNPIVIWRNIDKLAQIIRDHDVKIMHARSRAPAWSAYFAAQQSDIPFVTTFHGIYNFSTRLKKYYNSVMVKGDRIIAVSDFVKKHLIENYNADEAKIRVIHRGVDHKYFNVNHITPDSRAKALEKYHVPRDTPVLLLPARMTNWKGHMILLEAINLLKDQDFYCIMAGDLSRHTSFAQRVHNRIRELKLQSKVQMFGPESDMLNLYGIADVVLSTSIEPEAFGRVVIEAQSMEKLVISTNIGGAGETIVDGINGYHVAPNNPAELADKIKYALSIMGSVDAMRICTGARKSAIENFSLESMLTKTTAVYNELL